MNKILYFVFFLLLSINTTADEYNDNYGITLSRIMEGVNSEDLSISEGIVTLLEKMQGVEIDTIRFLTWLKEDDQILQEKLLKQLFTSSKLDRFSWKTKDILEKALISSLSIYDKNSGGKRKCLVEKSAKNSHQSEYHANEIVMTKKNSADENCISLIDPQYLLKNKKERSEVYRKLENFPGRSCTQLRILLWFAEPDPELQKYLLIQARKNGEDVRDISYIPNLMKMIKKLSPEQQTIRTKIIEELWKIKIKTLIDAGMNMN